MGQMTKTKTKKVTTSVENEPVVNKSGCNVDKSDTYQAQHCVQTLNSSILVNTFPSSSVKR